MVLFILTTIGVLLVAFFGQVVRKPERSIYLFTLASFVFPKNWNFELGGQPVLLYRAVQLLLFCIVVYAIWVHRDKRAQLRSRPSLRRFLLAFALVIGFDTLVPLLLAATGIRARPVEVSVLRQVFLATHYLFALALLAAAMLFLDSVERIEAFFKWVAICGIFGLLDFVFLYLLDIAPAIRDEMTGASGGFGGVFLGGPDGLGRMAIMIVFAALYFVSFRRSWGYFVLVVAGLLLVLVSGSRPVAISALAGFLLYLWLCRHQRQRVVRTPFFASLVLLIAIFLPWGVYVFQAEGAVVGSVQSVTQRQDYFQAGVGTLERLAIWARGLDVLIATFPFGTGGGLYPYYMAASIPAHFSFSGVAATIYARITAHEIVSAHNLYVEFIVENGLAGVILVGWYGLLCWRSYKTFRRLGTSLDEQHRYLLISTFCILFAAALNVMTDATFKAYWLYAILLSVAVILSGTAQPQFEPDADVSSVK